MSRFDWDDLRFFLAVARVGRLTVAARRLGADHATVSRRITALEDALKDWRWEIWVMLTVTWKIIPKQLNISNKVCKLPRKSRIAEEK